MVVRWLAALIVMTGLVVASGRVSEPATRLESGRRDGSPARARPASPRAPAIRDEHKAATTADGAGLAVEALQAEVRGTLAGRVEVEAEPQVGLLRTDEPLSSRVTFTNTASIPAEAPDLPFFSATAPASTGTGVLGVATLCGRSWRRDGESITYDPCAAAEPVRRLSPGESSWHIWLHARTEGGVAQPGRYQVQIPLSGSSAVALGWELRPHDPEALAPWPRATTELTISLEEIWLHNPHRRGRGTFVTRPGESAQLTTILSRIDGRGRC